MHGFWDTQPVPRDDTTPGEIEKERRIITEPHPLPNGFSWDTPSLDDAHTLLAEHYVSDETFRLTYSKETLLWASNGSGIGIRHDETGDLIGYISSVPLKVRVERDILDMVQINFLCVHPKHRSEGFAPILISEIKRIANTQGIWQAVYTAATRIPTPLIKSTYWHRFLNVKRLIKTGFYRTNRPQEKYFEVRGSSQFRRMVTRDIPKVTKILIKYFEGFKIAPVVDKEWVKHWILPINSYVCDDTDDFISFYDIPYDRVDGTDTVRQAYALYVVGDVYNDAFILARNQGYDVFNTLDVGQRRSDLETIKFLEGSGHVYYYLFNWLPKTPVGCEHIQLKLP
jgi:glycylpeptide N-tetradecanoyltransferase